MILAGLIAAGWIVWSAHRSLDGLIVKAGEARLTADTSQFFPDNAMRVFVCGSSSPLATRERAKTCIGVLAEGELLLFDVGAGSWRNIENWGIPPSALSRVFLTHFHSDHIADLDEANVQSWIMGRSLPIVVGGPDGVESVVAGYNAALALDYQYRNEYGTERLLPANAAQMRGQPILPADGEKTVVYKKGMLTVSAFLVDHSPVEPALGYRVDYGDRSIVISGDTRWTSSTRDISRNADILFHEAQSARLSRLIAEAAENVGDDRMAYVMTKAGDYHTRAEDFAKIAEETGAKKVVMYHLAPPPDHVIMKRMFLAGMPENVVLAKDGLSFMLVNGSSEVAADNLE